MIEKKEMEYAKETDDVLVLVIALIKVIKSKGDYSALMGKLITAVNGMGDIPEEVKRLGPLLTTVGSRVGELLEALSSTEESE